MERGKVFTSEAMVDHDQQTSIRERVSSKLNTISKERQQLNLFHLLHIFCYLQKGGGGKKT